MGNNNQGCVDKWTEHIYSGTIAVEEEKPWYRSEPNSNTTQTRKDLELKSKVRSVDGY